MPRRTVACGPRAFTHERAGRAMAHAHRKLRRRRRNRGGRGGRRGERVLPSRSHGVTHHLARPCKRPGRYWKGQVRTRALSACGEGCTSSSPPFPPGPPLPLSSPRRREKRGKRPRCVHDARVCAVCVYPPHVLPPTGPSVAYVPPESIAFH